MRKNRTLKALALVIAAPLAIVSFTSKSGLAQSPDANGTPRDTCLNTLPMAN
jgi:hypothetical protein